MSTGAVRTPVPDTGYGASALLSGVTRMWRATRPASLAITLNAALQAGLMSWNVPSGPSVPFAASALASGVGALGLYAVLAAAALESADGTAASPRVLSRAGAHLARFSLWALAQWALVLAALLITPPLVLLVAALTPFVPLAAMDGHSNALAANASAITSRWARWLITTAVLLVAGVTLLLLSALNTFFITGTPAAAILWLVTGGVAWWLLTSWALVYRTTPIGTTRHDPTPNPTSR